MNYSATVTFVITEFAADNDSNAVSQVSGLLDEFVKWANEQKKSPLIIEDLDFVIHE